jgi:hypothetical protein
MQEKQHHTAFICKQQQDLPHDFKRKASLPVVWAVRL